MRLLIATGRLTRDAQHKATANSEFCAFSLAADDGYGDNKTTIFYDVTKWGKGSAKLAEMLLKGTSVTVTGAHGVKEGSDGKQYQQINAQNVELMGSRPNRSDGASGGGKSYPRGAEGHIPGFDDDGDGIPFLTSDGMF